MVFVNVDKRLEKALSGLLEPGEFVVGAAFGMHTFSKETARKILIGGLYFFGLLCLSMFSDRVFLVITNRRILVVQLTTKYLYRRGQFFLSLQSVRNFEYERKSIYHMLQFHADGKLYRFAIPNFAVHSQNNGDRALAIANELHRLANAPQVLTPEVVDECDDESCIESDIEIIDEDLIAEVVLVDG